MSLYNVDIKQRRAFFGWGGGRLARFKIPIRYTRSYSVSKRRAGSRGKSAFHRGRGQN